MPDRLGDRLALEAARVGPRRPLVDSRQSWFLDRREISEAELERAARDVLVDPVVETHTIRPSRAGWEGPGTVVHVMPKPGVTDPEAESALALCAVSITPSPTSARSVPTGSKDRPRACRA